MCGLMEGQGDEGLKVDSSAPCKEGEMGRKMDMDTDTRTFL